MLLEKVVIGSTVESLMYSFLNGYHFLSSRRAPCLYYSALDFGILNCKTEVEAWEKFSFLQGLLGKLLSYKGISNIKVSEQDIKVSSLEGTHRHPFNECYIFDTSIAKLDNDALIAKPASFLVLDDFELSQLGPKQTSIPARCLTEVFAAKINFYSSDRVAGAQYITDCVVESTLTREQLYEFDHSDTMARFEVERYLQAQSIHGSFMGKYKNGSPKYRKPKVKHVKRLVFEQDNSIYADSPKIKFLKKTLKEVFDEVST